jgi:hypothetical protein
VGDSLKKKVGSGKFKAEKRSKSNEARSNVGSAPTIVSAELASKDCSTKLRVSGEIEVTVPGDSNRCREF